SDDLSHAVEDFSAAIRIAPKDCEAYYSRSLAYRDLGEADKSQEDESTARSLDPRINEEYSEMPETARPTPTAAAPPLEEAPADAEVSRDTDETPQVRSRAKADDYRSAADRLNPDSELDRKGSGDVREKYLRRAQQNAKQAARDSAWEDGGVALPTRR